MRDLINKIEEAQSETTPESLWFELRKIAKIIFNAASKNEVQRDKTELDCNKIAISYDDEEPNGLVKHLQDKEIGYEDVYKGRSFRVVSIDDLIVNMKVYYPQAVESALEACLDKLEEYDIIGNFHETL